MEYLFPPSSMDVNTTRYVIVTPVRNEAKRIEETIRSVVSQTVRPTSWVVVDDGSSDGTGDIVRRYSDKYSWISLITRSDRGFRSPGKGVMESFYEGLSQLASPDWEFLVKLDGDLKFQPSYFRECFQKFQESPDLGIGGGFVEEPAHGSANSLSHPVFHVRGATKIYRRACWEAIGGLILQPGWDTLDELKANMLGWQTRTFLEIRVLQLKHTGSADGVWKDMVKNGRANYISGYHPLFVLAKCLRRSVRRPYLIGACALFSGYVGAFVNRVPRVPDRALIAYIRNQQLRRLIGMQSIWA